MARTLVGIFDDANSARSVQQEIQALGVQPAHVRLLHNQDVQARPTGSPSPEGGQGWTEKFGNWFRSLVDDDADRSHADHYAEAWRRGHYLVVTDVENSWVDQVVAIMNRHGAVDVERRSEQWRQSGYSGRFDSTAKPYTSAQFEQERQTYRDASAAALGQRTAAARSTDAIPVVQEELAVGKRVVQRGGVRIHSYVQERPVEEMLRLRDEYIDVERRPVNRPADAADFAFQDRTVEVTARGEEAVVQKHARVVEEVVVNKKVSERDQRVAETLRRKDVQVENLPPDSAPASR